MVSVSRDLREQVEMASTDMTTTESILDHLSDGGVHQPADIAVALSLQVGNVRNVLQDLARNGRVHKTPVSGGYRLSNEERSAKHCTELPDVLVQRKRQPKCRHCDHWEDRSELVGVTAGWCNRQDAARGGHESHECHSEMTDAELEETVGDMEQNNTHSPLGDETAATTATDQQGQASNTGELGVVSDADAQDDTSSAQCSPPRDVGPEAPRADSEGSAGSGSIVVESDERICGNCAGWDHQHECCSHDYDVELTANSAACADWVQVPGGWIGVQESPFESPPTTWDDLDKRITAHLQERAELIIDVGVQLDEVNAELSPLEQRRNELKTRASDLWQFRALLEAGLT